MNRTTRRALWVASCALFVVAPSVRGDWIRDGEPVCTASGTQTYPATVSDGAGGAIIAWQDHRGPNGDLYLQRLDASGVAQWAPNGALLCGATNLQSNPVIVSDGAGGWIVAYMDSRTGAWDIYAQRVNGAGVPQWTANGVPICTAYEIQQSLAIVSDGAGGAIVVWSDYRNTASNNNQDIYAQRVSASGEPQWTANGVAICSLASYQGGPRIVPDGAGGAIVMWLDIRSGNNDFYAQRVDSDGAPLWAENGVPLCTATGNQLNLAVITDGSGGAIGTWWDPRLGDYNDNIYAQRISAEGMCLWAPNGAAICTAASEQSTPAIVTDGEGGAIIAWNDYRSGTWRIYAQRVNGSGESQWWENGLPLCDAEGWESGVILVSDGAGGAVAAWVDGRAADIGDVYAQRMNPDGALLWTPGGVPLCTAPNWQRNPTIAADGSNGAFVAWQDERVSSSGDIYAQRVDANGLVVTAATPPATAIELRQNYPNPFNPSTAVTFSLPERGAVRLAVFDVSGRMVARLIDGEREAGTHTVPWNGEDAAGNQMASGVYFCRLEAGPQTRMIKLVLIR